MLCADDWLKPALHPVYARLICAELQRRGFTADEIVKGTRLAWSDLHGQDRFVSYEQARRLMVRALALSECPWLGLHIGANTQLSAHGMLGYAAMSAANVGQVLLLVQRFIGVRTTLAEFEIETESALVLSVKQNLTSPDVHEALVGYFASSSVNILESITGQSVRQHIKVAWPFDAPPWVHAYETFCSQMTFGAPILRLELPVGFLQTPSLAPDPDAYRMALRECERQLHESKAGQVALRVQERLLACQRQYPSLSDMAALEHTSTRTLIRHLRQEGWTYQQLLDIVREEQACWLLTHSAMSTEAIAEQLGYTDTSNFSRTFKRWVGQTPRAFRQGTVPSHLFQENR